ncbi:hypothetical protein AJ87_13160 [Rhizobium yanglingense]|nr:hypothetical protein AJ87_13160 [Rhizobium yanglingense]
MLKSAGAEALKTVVGSPGTSMLNAALGLGAKQMAGHRRWHDSVVAGAPAIILIGSSSISYLMRFARVAAKLKCPVSAK